MRNPTITAVIIAALATVACDEGNDNTPDEQERSVTACSFADFEVELTAGPSAPLTLTGTLFVAASAADAGVLRGMFEVGDAQYPVTSSYTEGGQISVSVAVGGGYVVGLGRVDALCQSGATIEGVAVGPTVSATHSLADSDTGHWLLNGGTLTTLQYTYDFIDGTPETGYQIVKIPVNEVCKQQNVTKASCYENFCQAQKAGHYSADASSGEPICS